MRRTRLTLAFVALTACEPPASSPSVPSWPQPDAASVAHDAGATQPSGPTSDAVGARSDASEPREAGVEPREDAGPSRDAGAVSAADAEAAEAAQPAAAEPCGEDLASNGGNAAPSYGQQPGLDGSRLDLEKLGSYTVREQSVEVPLRAETRNAANHAIQIEAGTISGTVYAPSSDGGKTIVTEKLPLLVAGPGFGAGYADYAELFRHFASYGVLVLGINTRANASAAEHDKEALETSQAISWMLQASGYADHLDADKIAVCGHSKGGKVAFFTAAIDPRVDIVFGWDPSNAGGPPCEVAASLGLECNALPVAPNCLAEKDGDERAEGILHYSRAESFIVGVPPDPATNPTPEHNSIHFYRGALRPATLVYMNGGHAAWVTGGIGALLGDANVVRVTKAVQTAKLLRVFFGATGLDRYLPGGDYLMQQGPLVRQVATK